MGAIIPCQSPDQKPYTSGVLQLSIFKESAQPDNNSILTHNK